MDLDVALDQVIQCAQNEAMNEFLAGTSRCDEVGGDVKAEGQGSSISVQFGGNQVDVQIAEGTTPTPETQWLRPQHHTTLHR